MQKVNFACFEVHIPVYNRKVLSVNGVKITLNH